MDQSPAITLRAQEEKLRLGEGRVKLSPSARQGRAVFQRRTESEKNNREEVKIDRYR